MSVATRVIHQKVKTDTPLQRSRFFADQEVPEYVDITISPTDEEAMQYEQAMEDYHNGVNIVSHEDVLAMFAKR